MFPLNNNNNKKVEVEQADSAVFLDIPPLRWNMANNNKYNNITYMCSIKETKVFLDLIQKK